jgi:hypothetical protein
VGYLLRQLTTSFSGGGGGYGGGPIGGLSETPKTTLQLIPSGLFASLSAGDTPEGKCWNAWFECNQKVNDIISELQKKQKEELKTCIKDCALTLFFGGEAYAVCLKVCTSIWVSQAAGDAAAQDLGYRICDARLDSCLQKAGAPPR